MMIPIYVEIVSVFTGKSSMDTGVSLLLTLELSWIDSWVELSLQLQKAFEVFLLAFLIIVSSCRKNGRCWLHWNKYDKLFLFHLLPPFIQRNNVRDCIRKTSFTDVRCKWLWNGASFNGSLASIPIIYGVCGRWHLRNFAPASVSRQNENTEALKSWKST